MTYCTECGTPQEPGSRFCTGCGKQVSATSATSSEPPPTAQRDDHGWGDDHGWVTYPPTDSRSPRRLVVALTALVLALGASVAAWALLTDDTAAAPTPSPPPTLPPIETSTSHAPAPPARVSSEGAALDQLTQQISLDRPQVQRDLAEAWVPQLSSKRPGLVVDGVPYSYLDILDDHLALRSRYGARLVWSGDWSTFQDGDFYVTVATEPFSTPAEANAWCDRQVIDRKNCFAKRLSTAAGPDGSTVSR
ncbi:MAG: hypothetical protein ACRDSL_15025 [Pseudonocardiaceae bacterium]